MSEIQHGGPRASYDEAWHMAEAMRGHVNMSTTLEREANANRKGRRFKRRAARQAMRIANERAGQVEMDFDAIRGAQESPEAQAFLAAAISRAKGRESTKGVADSLMDFWATTDLGTAYESLHDKTQPPLARLVKSTALAMVMGRKVRSNFLLAGSEEPVHNWDTVAHAQERDAGMNTYAESRGVVVPTDEDIADAYTVLGIDMDQSSPVQMPEPGTSGGTRRTYHMPHGGEAWEPVDAPQPDGVNLQFIAVGEQMGSGRSTPYFPPHLEVNLTSTPPVAAA